MIMLSEVMLCYISGWAYVVVWVGGLGGLGYCYFLVSWGSGKLSFFFPHRLLSKRGSAGVGRTSSLYRNTR